MEIAAVASILLQEFLAFVVVENQLTAGSNDDPDSAVFNDSRFAVEGDGCSSFRIIQQGSRRCVQFASVAYRADTKRVLSPSLYTEGFTHQGAGQTALFVNVQHG